MKIDFLEFHGGIPCLKMELVGCQRTACEGCDAFFVKNTCTFQDINECEDGRNGGCEQHCHNTQGDHRCNCDEGFDLFTQPGQEGVRLREGETGFGQFDSLRYNRSCIARHCAPLKAPENGQMIGEGGVDAGRNQSSTPFAFPAIVEFRCAFGHQMRGPSHLKCLADGQWNGTAPTCIRGFFLIETNALLLRSCIMRGREEQHSCWPVCPTRHCAHPIRPKP